MGFYEDRRDGQVYEKLKKRGMIVYLTKSTGTFDEETGEYSESKKLSYPVYALQLGVKKRRQTGGSGGAVAGTTVSENALMFMMEATNTPADIDVGYRLLVGNKSYKILSLNPFSPGGVDLFYDVEVEQ